MVVLALPPGRVEEGLLLLEERVLLGQTHGDVHCGASHVKREGRGQMGGRKGVEKRIIVNVSTCS